MLNNVGKLEVATGDFEAAQHDFQTVATMTTEPKVQAEAHHNAYQAALERQQWTEALAAVQQAIAIDPARFTPFPLERYEPKRILGAGGFGVVFLCQHRHLVKPVVIKALLASELDRTITDVFAEARALEDLNHPAIIRLRDCDFADSARSRPYLVMDYFDGVNLESYVAERGPLSPEDMLAVACPVAEALQAAHACEILHRDVKPANVLLRRDGEVWRVKLIDFGLALRPGALPGTESTQDPRAQTTTGRSMVGTLHFAAPEQMGQLPGVAVGPHSDVYGFGKSCYYALLGTSHPDDVEKDTLPEGWRKFLAKCTGRTLANRWQNFAEVLAGLVELSKPASVKATPQGSVPEGLALEVSPGPAPGPTKQPTALPALLEQLWIRGMATARRKVSEGVNHNEYHECLGELLEAVAPLVCGDWRLNRIDAVLPVGANTDYGVVSLLEWKVQPGLAPIKGPQTLKLAVGFLLAERRGMALDLRAKFDFFRERERGVRLIILWPSQVEGELIEALTAGTRSVWEEKKDDHWRTELRRIGDLELRHLLAARELLARVAQSAEPAGAAEAVREFFLQRVSRLFPRLAPLEAGSLERDRQQVSEASPGQSADPALPPGPLPQ